MQAWATWIDSSGGELRLWLSMAAAFAAASLLGIATLRPAARRPRSARPSPSHLPPIWRFVWLLLTPFEGPAAATIGPRRRVLLETRLRQAGLATRLDPVRYRALCWVAAIAGAAAFAWGAAALGMPRASATAALLGAMVAAMLPVARVRDRAASRQRSILRQLPFYLDLITMSVEAGLSLAAALAQAVDRGPAGPMREELEQMLRDLRAGRTRDEALKAMAARVQLPAVSNLVAALATAHKQGASLGPILRAQAEQRRTERFLRAEKLAMEAPVKMLLPLALFIFPGTFAVLLFPVISRLMAEGVL